MIAADERAAMEETVRTALTDAAPSGGGEMDADAVLAKLGWLDLLREQPDDAIGIVFAALGATRATATALDDVLTWALGWEPRADLSVLLPPFASWDPPGRIEAGELHAKGLALAGAPRARELLVVVGPDSPTRAAVVATHDLELRRVWGIDPDSRFHAIELRVADDGVTALDSAAWASAVGFARRAVAHQMAGACRAMLDLARTHALERHQFGRPIARFQAVRHRLAQALVAVESLDAALAAARDDGGPETAALAKGVAGRTARSVARHTQQVLAGIGFTTEHPFHLLLKRTLALEGLFGSADAIALAAGRRLLAERRVPTLIEL